MRSYPRDTDFDRKLIELLASERDTIFGLDRITIRLRSHYPRDDVETLKQRVQYGIEELLPIGINLGGERISIKRVRDNPPFYKMEFQKKLGAKK